MPEKSTMKRARADKRAGKSASTQAGEFVREEIHHVREGKHGARSTKQAIAIGLSKARRAGVKLPPQKRSRGGKTARAMGRTTTARSRRKPSPARARAMSRALRREPHRAASHTALSRHAHQVAANRTKADRSASARKAVRTKGPMRRRAAARKAAATRQRAMHD